MPPCSSARCKVPIYFTCKHMSTELLCNVTMILGIIYDVLQRQPHKVLRNQEKVLLQGDKGYRDVRRAVSPRSSGAL